VKDGGWSGVYIDLEDNNLGLLSGSPYLITLCKSLRTSFNSIGMPNALIVVFGEQLVQNNASYGSWTWNASYAVNVVNTGTYIEESMYETGITTASEGSTAAAIADYKAYIENQTTIARSYGIIANTIFGMAAYPDTIVGDTNDNIFHDPKVENIAVAASANVLQCSNTDVFIYSTPTTNGTVSGLVSGNLPGSTLANYTNFLNNTTKCG